MENLSIPTLRVLYKHYVNWVSAHPERTTDLEASIKWISYFLAGRINNSTLLSELIYSMSNFMMLFNDQIILSTTKPNPVTVSDKGKKKIFSSENIKRFITTVDYIEVFIEVSAKKLWGNKGRWIIIVLLQTVKCMARLYLLHVHKLHILESPPIQPLDRKSVGLKCNDTVDGVITLPSGRTIRKLDNAPPMNRRTWEAPPRADKLGGIPGRTLSDRHIVAETMYIMKPIVHLGSMCVFGEQSWKPWLISITIEYISLQRLKSLKNLSPQQRLVLSKRSLNLAMYIVRSPFFENYSEKHIRLFLHWFVNSVPLVGPLMRPFLEYMKQWQETYFYLWSV
ncbi:peroxisomal membrane protein PEX16 [Rhopalosiphum maidis]|uniref:peroxisomal membrane protein PEX16 n=1 Tax=Rhopalosiphum maidis TaxID=43146 RepID=UPI000F003791|nr:peroxisomal membrane protein PEX16 [Rhopalosiphum maidis]